MNRQLVYIIGFHAVQLTKYWMRGRNYRIQGHSGPAYANWLESFVERGR